MNMMLINATQQDELRVALVKNASLYDVDFERPGRKQKKANIYRGRITRIEPSLEAAFVDYGASRHGFLPLKEVNTHLFPRENPESSERIHIKDVLKEGQELMVQVDKEERGTKGAALTTFISLAGSYLVLMPNNPRAGGISRRIEGAERDELKTLLSKIVIPDGMGLIVRTAGVGKDLDELQWDLDVLLKQWSAISTASTHRKAPFLIYQESDVVNRAIRDYLRKDIAEIIVDDAEVFAKVKQHIEAVRPDFIDRLKLHEDKIPLFNYYKIENQIESAFQRELSLPSGGAIVLDRTEALLSIDINSARATAGSDIEETALNTNLEAADEIARQLRLRDLGGLIVIDFIDMMSIRNQRAVEQRLRDAMRIDRARVQVGRISRFGLLELSRQRLRPTIGEAAQMVCPRCSGQGTIRGTESLSASLVRIVEQEAIKEHIGRIQLQVPIDVATFLLNEKRNQLSQIEERHQVGILVIPNQHLERPKYQINTFRSQDRRGARSYQMAQKPQEEIPLHRATRETQPDEPAVKNVPLPSRPSKKSSKSGLIKRVFSGLFGAQEPEKEETKRAPQRRHRPPSNRPTRRPAARRTSGTGSGNRGTKRTNTTGHPTRRGGQPHRHRNPQQTRPQNKPAERSKSEKTAG